MSEYGCKECPENCRASANKKPIYCLYSGVDRARWREVTADTPPKLTAEEKLPDWCKVGAWVWWKGASDIGYAPGYMKITGISNEIINCDAIQGIPIAQNQIFEARLRPWTFEEAPISLKVKADDPHKTGFESCTSIVCDLIDEWSHDDNMRDVRFKERDCIYWEDSENKLETGRFISAKEMMKDYEQLDGLPCGVLEHKEGDGWVR